MRITNETSINQFFTQPPANPFLAHNRPNTRENRTPITAMQCINSIITEETKECIGEEKTRLCIRFNDLTPETQAKFSVLLQKDTSVLTVSRLTPEEIQNRLRIGNPVMARNYRSTFSFGAFTRYREQKLSSLVYNIGRPYYPNLDNTGLKQTINYLLQC